MSGGLTLILALVAVAAALVVVLVAVPRRRTLVAVNEVDFPGLAHLRRSTLLTRPVALVLGLAVAAPVAAFGHLGQGLALVPAVFAAVQVLGVLAGDIVARDDARTPGSAGLEVRRVRDVLPVRLTLLVTLAAGALALLLGWATAVAGPDDAGRAGRWMTYTCAEDCTTGGLGPWPGSFYSVPMTLTLLVVAGLGALAVVVTVRRPRNGSDPEILRVDDAVRRRSVESVVASMGIAVSASLAGTGLLAGLGLAGESRAPLGLQIAGSAALAAGLASLILLTWCLVLLAVPGGPGASDRAVGSRGQGAHG